MQPTCSDSAPFWRRGFSWRTMSITVCDCHRRWQVAGVTAAGVQPVAAAGGGAVAGVTGHAGWPPSLDSLTTLSIGARGWLEVKGGACAGQLAACTGTMARGAARLVNIERRLRHIAVGSGSGGEAGSKILHARGWCAAGPAAAVPMLCIGSPFAAACKRS